MKRKLILAMATVLLLSFMTTQAAFLGVTIKPNGQSADSGYYDYGAYIPSFTPSSISIIYNVSSRVRTSSASVSQSRTIYPSSVGSFIQYNMTTSLNPLTPIKVRFTSDSREQNNGYIAGNFIP